MKQVKIKKFSLPRKAKITFGSAGLLAVTALLVGVLSFQEPMEVYASTDPGLDAGNATIDRTSVPGQTILKYTTVGNSTFKAPAGVTDVRVLIIGGGGGGGAGELNNAGDGGGGGGAGEYLHQTSSTVTPGQAMTVTVGGGGAGSTTKQNDGGTTAQNGANGANSLFGSLTARGGGGAGGNDQHGLAGGSGGGAGGKCSSGNLSGGASSAVAPGVGNAGGNSAASGCGPRGASGGGGAGAVGTNSSGSGGATGGAGLQNDITGTNSFYAAGGGGGGAASSGAGANGGSSIGGNGGNASGGIGTVGAANTGSGGGGGGSSVNTSGGNGGNGGSGVVIVRFATQNFPDPGGISGAVAWYKADSVGNTNAQWNDVSGFNNHLTQATAANQPALTTNALNFNPAYVFDGTDDVFRMPYNGLAATDSLSVFYTANSTSDSGGDRYINEFGDDHPSISSYNGKPRLYVLNTSSVDDQYSTAEALQPHIYSFVSPNNGGTKVIGVDNREETKSISGAYTTGSGGTGATFGRKNVSSGTSWQGPVSEAIYFNRQLTAVERQRVNSYLAIKYGIPLGSGIVATEYLDSGNAAIWPADNTYRNNIAGIGRDDTSTLNQKQSKSAVDGGLVTIGHGNIAASNQANTNNFTNDKTFLIWGNNGASTTTSTTVTGTYKRMDRIWKAVTTNTVGQVKVQIPTSAVTTGNNGILYVSTSSTFDGSAQQIPLTVNGANYEADVTFPTGTRYFSFGSFTGADIQGVSKTTTDVSGNAITNYTPGQALKYHLVFRNNGPDAAGTVTVTDTLPTGIVPKTNGATGSGWTCNVAGQTVTCTRPSLASGATAPEIEIEANIASSVSGQKVNTANAAVANDPDTSNNSVSVTLNATLKADLSITKAHTGTPTAGNPFTYNFVVTNDGPSDVASFTVTDTLDANLTYQSSTITCTGTTSLSCTGGALAAGATASFSITVQVDPSYAGGVISNTATVAVPAGVADPNTANNTSAPDDSNVTVSTDLTISKSHTGNFIAGENNTFTINVTNNGPSTAPTGSVTVTDTLDEDFSFVSATGTNWTCTESSGTVTCTYGSTLASAATSTNITLTVLVDSIADTPTNNIAEVTGTTPDPDLTNNASTDTVTIVAEADLALTKGHVGTMFTPGQQEQYTFTVTNNGPSADSPSYQITDTLPAGLTYVSYTGDADCSPSSGTSVVCNGGAIGAGDPAQVTTITVAVDPSATGTFNNSATVAVAAGVTDPTPANNTGNDTVTIEPNADLSMDKTAPTSIVAGDTVDYTLTTTNNGPSNVTSYTVTDNLDPNVTFQSSTPGGACTVTGTTSQGGEQLTCNGGAVTSSGTDAITVTVAVDATASVGATIDNTATTVIPAGVNDPNTANNTDTVSSTVTTSADLAVTKTHTGNFDVGGNGTFTIQATNNGPSDADTATITDVLPAGLTYVNATSPDASCSNAGQTVTCTVGPTMSNGQTATITLEVTVNVDVTATSIDNTATISSATSDPNSGNNSSLDTVTIDPAEADLATTKTLQGSLMAGETATYRFEVTNNGPDNAGVISIQDTLASYLSYQSFTSVSGGSWNCSANGQDVACTLPVLNNGDTAVVDVVVLVAQDAPDTADNSGTVTFNGTDTSTNSPSTSDPVSHEADLDLGLAFDSEMYQSGDTVTLTYTVTNHGPSAAEDVVLTDTLPSGLTFENIVAANDQTDNSVLAKAVDTILGSVTASAAPNTPFDCSNSGQDISCTASILFTGTYVITLTAKISDGYTGNLASVAELTSSTFDPDGTVASASATATVTAASGLAGTGYNIFVWIAAALVLAAISGLLIWRKYQRV